MTRPALALFLLALLAAGDERLARHRNLGKAFFENPTTQAQSVAEFRKALALQPDSARERLNLGIAYLANGQTAEGIAEIERVQKQHPSIPHTWWNLGIQYKKAGDYEKAQRQLEHFVKLVPGEAVGHYNLGTLHKLSNRAEEAVKAFERASALDPNLAAAHFQLFNLYRQAGRREESAQRLQLFQKTKDAQANAATPEDVEWSFYSEIYDPAEAAPPSALKPVAPKFASRRAHASAPGMVVVEMAGKPVVLPYKGVAADINNDGLADVCAITAQGAQLLVNVKGKLEPRPLPVQGPFTHCVALDYDRDYDLDLLLFGPKNVLLRNQGEAGFVERSGDFPFVAGTVLSAHVFRVIPDSKSLDLLVSYKDRPAMLYRDLLGGKYEAHTLDAIPAGELVWQVADLDANSTMDVLTNAYVLSNREGKFTRSNRPSPGPAVAADFDNRGVAELHTTPRIPAGQAFAVADFNLDGKLDVAVHTREGAIEILTNQTLTPHGWSRVSLLGTKNLKLAPGAEVEVKAGAAYRKQIYEGVPLLFGLAANKTIDTVRITWPNGLIQNEINAAANRPLAYKEAQRLSGSCPQVWTWNGREFEYVTDVLGVAPLGASDGDGSYFPTDSLEHIQLPNLQPRNGFYEVRLTEELAEVAYLDRIRLLTVDHPADTEIYLNEKFQAPPYPELEVFAVRERVRPVPGTLDFPQLPAKPLMILRGWTDWADGSLFRHFSQIPGKALRMPVLEYQGGDGVWRVALEDLGLPAGKPKAFAVRVPPARRYRIRSNIDVHWTAVELAEVDERPVRVNESLPTAAHLDFRGFSRLTQTRPDLFTYEDPQVASMWNPTPGMYTRYGEVLPLLTQADDQLTILGSGDELALRFAVPPPPAAGYRRSFVLAVDGWAKDQDPNTAHSQTVEPLPFRGMASYPYPVGVRHPGGKLNQEFNTRPALRLLRPLGNISD
jgi:Flp pilus assembly protein TadD